MRTVIINGEEHVEALITCSLCGRPTLVVMPKAGYDAWQAGGLIQNVLPQLTEGERELLISQTCCPCFHSLFEGDDDGEA